MISPGSPIAAPLIYPYAADCLGDVNGDGKREIVLCGNSGQSHVLGYNGIGYEIQYNSPKVAGSGAFTQTCGVGDFNGDGRMEWFDVAAGLVRVFGYIGSFPSGNYGKIWEKQWGGTYNNGIGAGAAGDTDNDGRSEFIHTTDTNLRKILLWESDAAPPVAAFFSTFSFPGNYTATVLVGKLR